MTLCRRIYPLFGCSLVSNQSMGLSLRSRLSQSSPLFTNTVLGITAITPELKQIIPNDFMAALNSGICAFLFRSYSDICDGSCSWSILHFTVQTREPAVGLTRFFAPVTKHAHMPIQCDCNMPCYFPLLIINKGFMV